MDIIVAIGAGLSVIGLLGIVYSIVMVVRAKRANLSDADLRARMGKVLPVNLGALFVSVLGLMTVALGLMLG
ncbi:MULTISPECIES: hypothetical protein [unclassified Yoonia]|uniref:hypothetical protein n=1 Tax=unclassified Yoonia TaxID=2629118 RepID=UPI002B001BA2|nr:MULTISPECIES: hypothetical protein [unclassified Yoonia]